MCVCVVHYFYQNAYPSTDGKHMHTLNKSKHKHNHQTHTHKHIYGRFNDLIQVVRLFEFINWNTHTPTHTNTSKHKANPDKQSFTKCSLRGLIWIHRHFYIYFFFWCAQSEHYIWVPSRQIQKTREKKMKFFFFIEKIMAKNAYFI